MCCLVLTNFHINTTLQLTWKGMLYHLCGRHSWASGACEHGTLTEVELAEPIFDPQSAPFKALEAYVTSKALLQQFPYYVHFM